MWNIHRTEITVGDLFTIAGSDIKVVVKKLIEDGNSFRTECFLMLGAMDKEVKMFVPVDKLSECQGNVCFTFADRKLLSNLKREAFYQSLQHGSTNVNVFNYNRFQQIRKLVFREACASLRARSSRKSFIIGVISTQVEFDRFQIKNRTSCFGHKCSNLEDLDEMLLPKWDILDEDGQIAFVTEITFQLRKDVLMATCYTARCMQRLGEDYRKYLAEYIWQAANCSESTETQGE